MRIPRRAAANLCELFVQELSHLVAGACQADQLARALFAAIASDQVRLRRLGLGLAESTRGCLPALPAAWSDYLCEVRRQEKSFRAQAYAADF